jgi:hypothetical protein
MEFLKNHIIYPVKSIQEKTEGTVYIELIIDETGRISRITEIKSVHPLLVAEAIRVMWLSHAKWKPAMYNNRPVKSSIIVPVTFAIIMLISFRWPQYLSAITLDFIRGNFFSAISFLSKLKFGFY